MRSAVVVEDDRSSLAALLELVEREGFTTRGVDSVAAARSLLEDGPAPGVVLIDLMLPDGSGLDLVEVAAGMGAQVVLITGHASVETAVEALRRGATDYLTKPVDLARLKTILANVTRTRELQSEIGSPPGGPPQPGGSWPPAAAAGGGGQGGALWAPGGRVGGDGLGLRSDRARGADRRHGVHRGRERHGQGGGGAGGARAEPAAQGAVRTGQLRGGVAESDREHALWAREGQLHGGRAHAPRGVRAGLGRDVVSRRGERDAAGAAGEAAAGAGDGDGDADRGGEGDCDRRGGDRGDQPGAGAGTAGGAVARGPVVPAERVSDTVAAAARAGGGHRGAGGALSGGAERGDAGAD